MLMTFDAVSKLITDGKVLHIAGTESLLRRLPQGNWVGGSTEYFMAPEGGVVTGEQLFVTEFPYDNYSIKSYDIDTIKNVASDAYDNGFTILIIPTDCRVHIEYAEHAADYEGMFIKNIAGWISGTNVGESSQTPIVVNGTAAEAYPDKAVALHLQVPQGKIVSINIINIFEQDENSPIIEFLEDGFHIKDLLVDGEKMTVADYLAHNNIDTELPLVGDYSGNGINISYKYMKDGVATLCAPVFTGVKYRLAKKVEDYEREFNAHLAGFRHDDAVFSCNCLFNFMYGKLEGKCVKPFFGPITFGEIAYQLLNQTLVYVTVSD